MHARSGGNIEVMGLMQGKIMDDTMIILDSFALPVEGTETRVNAAAEGYEYMVEYLQKIREVRPRTDCCPRRLPDLFDSKPGRSFGKRDWLVPLASWIRLLVVRYRCEYANAQPTISGTLVGDRRGWKATRVCPGCALNLFGHKTDRPEPDDFCRESRNWCFPYLPGGIQASG